MNISAIGLNLIKHSEGFRSEVYLDINGFASIGYGHRILAGEEYPEGITEEQAAEILEDDLRIAERAVNHLVLVTLTQGQYDALVDFCYNLGQGSLRQSTLLKLLDQGDYEEAGKQILLWDHVGGKEVEGLKLRREAEYRLWESA
jgi:lysozyme